MKDETNLPGVAQDAEAERVLQGLGGDSRWCWLWADCDRLRGHDGECQDIRGVSQYGDTAGGE